MKNEIELSKTYWASVSGGKDSLYMLAHILHNLDKYPLNGVVHFELPYEYPFIKDVVDYMESECKRFNIPFIRIKPRYEWMELYNKYKYPTRRLRWCNKYLKVDCAKQLSDMMLKQNKLVIYYIGYCANEIKRAEKHSKPTEIYPLVDCGIYEETIWEWAKNQPLFNDYYKYNKRCGCMYCPMQDMNNTKYNSIYYPEEYAWYMNLAQRSEQIYGNSVWQGNPKYNTEYRINRIAQMELKEIERW